MKKVSLTQSLLRYAVSKYVFIPIALVAFMIAFDIFDFDFDHQTFNQFFSRKDPVSLIIFLFGTVAAGLIIRKLFDYLHLWFTGKE